MLRRLVLTLLVPGLVLGAPLLGSGARAGDDDEAPARKKDDRGTRLEIELKDGRVRVRMKTEDGRTLEREMRPDEFFRGLFGEGEKGERPSRAELERKLKERLDGLRERLSRLGRPHRDDGGRGEDQDDVFSDLQKALEKLPERLEKALGQVEKETPGRARELEKRLETALKDLLDAVRPEGEKVRVRVGDREMEVPARKGKARLY